MAGERPRNLLRVKDSGFIVILNSHTEGFQIFSFFCDQHESWASVYALNRQDELLRGIVMQCSRMVESLS